MNESKSEAHKPVSVDPSVDFVLNHPDMSPWLKDALAAALDRDTWAVLNDLEMLHVLFRTRAAQAGGCRQLDRGGA